MTLLDRIFGKKETAESRELDEWDYHHNSAHQSEAEGFFNSLWERPNMTKEQLMEAQVRANKLIGHRAPADYAEFMAYGYVRGRLDALRIK